ncbi:MAG TPA: ATP-binding protein [Negativicutes bacterium]|nr:ATP-binding protein [Negativicutes bacterium]
MEPISKIMASLLTGLGKPLDLTSRCEICGEPIARQLEVVGTPYIVPSPCSCSREKWTAADEADRKAKQLRKIERLNQYSLHSEDFYRCTFENWERVPENERYYQLGIRFIRNWEALKAQNIGLMIYGEPGNGKSYMSFCIANRLLEKLVPVLVIKSIDLLDLIRRTYDSYGDMGEIEILDLIDQADLLVLDDLGAENLTSWGKATLYKVIDRRYRSNKMLFITTNLKPEDLRRKLIQEDGVSRIYDRIIGLCTPYKVAGESRRRKEGMEKYKALERILGGDADE